MASGNTIAEVANLIGDAARANIMAALMGGQALTAGELSRHAGVTAQTTSGHLGKLLAAGLIAVERQGRHRYYRISSTEVAEAIHGLMSLASIGPKRHHPIGPRDEALRIARTCYDHMAGRLSVRIMDSLLQRTCVVIEDGVGLITGDGQRFFRELGIDLDAERRVKRPLCRTCLDWSERRPHLAGRLGASLLDRLLLIGWIARQPENRALRVTQAGETGLIDVFQLEKDWRHPGS